MLKMPITGVLLNPPSLHQAFIQGTGILVGGWNVGSDSQSAASIILLAVPRFHPLPVK
jgi:hypothetical protein